jgi:hypothetical protein
MVAPSHAILPKIPDAGYRMPDAQPDWERCPMAVFTARFLSTIVTEVRRTASPNALLLKDVMDQS